MKIVGYRDGRDDLLLNLNAKALSEMPGSLFCDNSHVSTAILKAQRSKTLDEADAEIQAAQLGDSDVAWLEDMKVLAGAEAASRFGAHDIEAERIDTFVSRQPMLFEADLALTFHQLRYQENLKVRYQENPE